MMKNDCILKEIVMSDDYRKIFVRKLAYYMQLNGKKQIDLMHDLGLKSATVSSWCTGKKLPRVDKIQLLADYFHIEKSDLLEDKITNNKETFARNLKRLMEENGKSRTDICKALNIKYTTLTDWINAKTYPRIDTLQLLANYFHVSKAAFVEECNSDYDSFSLSEEEKKIVKAWRKASESERKLILYALNLLDMDDMRKIFESRMK